MKEINSLANISALKQYKWEILRNTRRKGMKKGSNTFAKIVATMRQLNRAILKYIRMQCVKEWNTLANNAARK